MSKYPLHYIKHMGTMKVKPCHIIGSHIYFTHEQAMPEILDLDVEPDLTEDGVKYYKVYAIWPTVTMLTSESDYHLCQLPRDPRDLSWSRPK